MGFRIRIGNIKLMYNSRRRIIGGKSKWNQEENLVKTKKILNSAIAIALFPFSILLLFILQFGQKYLKK